MQARADLEDLRPVFEDLFWQINRAANEEDIRRARIASHWDQAALFSIIAMSGLLYKRGYGIEQIASGILLLYSIALELDKALKNINLTNPENLFTRQNAHAFLVFSVVIAAGLTCIETRSLAAASIIITAALTFKRAVESIHNTYGQVRGFFAEPDQARAQMQRQNANQLQDGHALNFANN